jgi:hypothetical protein
MAAIGPRASLDEPSQLTSFRWNEWRDDCLPVPAGEWLTVFEVSRCRQAMTTTV